MVVTCDVLRYSNYMGLTSGTLRRVLWCTRTGAMTDVTRHSMRNLVMTVETGTHGTGGRRMPYPRRVGIWDSTCGDVLVARGTEVP